MYYELFYLQFHHSPYKSHMVGSYLFIEVGVVNDAENISHIDGPDGNL